MTTVFADTFYFLAICNPKDRRHAAARAIIADFTGTMVTTQWVVTEWADALCDPINRPVFLALHTEIRADSHMRILAATDSLFDKGLELFGARPDKTWSLTDCISFAVMSDLGLTDALTGDRHFEQAGFVALLK